jgi:selenocysteine-specific elongation factor
LLERKFIGIGSRYIEEKLLLTCKEEILSKASKLGGITFEELKASSEIPDNCVAYCIQQLIDEKTLFANKQILTTIGPQQKELSPDEKRFLVRIQNAGIHGVESKQLSKEDRLLLRALTREGHTIVLDGLLIYTLETYKMMAQKVLSGKNKGDLFSIADAKTNLSLSRKYIIPLLNKMEEDKMVERIGDNRRVL